MTLGYLQDNENSFSSSFISAGLLCPLIQCDESVMIGMASLFCYFPSFVADFNFENCIEMEAFNETSSVYG